MKWVGFLEAARFQQDQGQDVSQKSDTQGQAEH